MSPWERLLEKPQPRGHFLQLYRPGDDASLVSNTGIYLSEGLKRGEGALIVAEPCHCTSFLAEVGRYGIDTATAVGEHRMVVRDAEQTLATFMNSGQPDWNRFEHSIGSALAEVRSSGVPPHVRVYGEMVGVLWNQRQYGAAARLEQFWNRLLTRFSFSLYCSYSIDVLEKEFHARALDGILCTHTHVLPSDSQGRLEVALQAAMESVLGGKAQRIRNLIQANYKSSWAVMPGAESAILWLRRNLPDQAEQIVNLTRAQLGASARPA
ncbi:MAG TPA: MEDS domain-containing protein [Bryobacteraceae bacterium]